MIIEPSRAAGPISIYRPDKSGNLKLVETRPVVSRTEPVKGKRGPKPKSERFTNPYAWEKI